MVFYETTFVVAVVVRLTLELLSNKVKHAKHILFDDKSILMIIKYIIMYVIKRINNVMDIY